MARKNPITGKPMGQISIKPKKTRKIIRSYHELLKKQAVLKQTLQEKGQSERINLEKELQNVQEDLDNKGGLATYQQASIAGQGSNRGGDSSRILVSWLRGQGGHDSISLPNRSSLLEVGCLSIYNACSTENIFDSIERIDLNSQHPLIKRQDFMERPLAKDDGDFFDVISLSLVVNYVPEPQQRGDMLRRTTQFLRTDGLLFLVLPSPCILNSRYFNEQLLFEIMASLGYSLERSKVAKKIFYWLFRKVRNANSRQYPKRLVNDGKVRNNFTIILR
jgi:25S rRNA (adenine2142-N1)-methyltransferase